MNAARGGYTGSEMNLLTLGHGVLTQPEIASLVRAAGIGLLVDVRSVPKSRLHPWVWGERMAIWIPAETGAQYVWERDLGGFRRPQPSSHHTALRNPAFRAYADYMETELFTSALRRLVGGLEAQRTAVMCSETLWWRCHRRLIADAAELLEGVPVEHLTARGTTQPHVLTQGVRRCGGALRYDLEAA